MNAVKRLYLITLVDGTECGPGEYIGAQDGCIFLATGDEVMRLDQRKIAAMIVVERRVP